MHVALSANTNIQAWHQGMQFQEEKFSSLHWWSEVLQNCKTWVWKPYTNSLSLLHHIHWVDGFSWVFSWNSILKIKCDWGIRLAKSISFLTECELSFTLQFFSGTLSHGHLLFHIYICVYVWREKVRYILLNFHPSFVNILNQKHISKVIKRLIQKVEIILLAEKSKPHYRKQFYARMYNKVYIYLQFQT